MKIAFDIDDTLLLHPGEEFEGVFRPDKDPVPNFELITVLKWFKTNGDDIYFWSAGGQDYCKAMLRKLGLQKMGKVIEKENGTDMDLCFDDQTVNLAKVNIKVK